MFTGIVEEKGTVKSLSANTLPAKIKIECHKVLEGTNTGDSIAVNGVCLTATEITENSFTADVMNETLERSSLGSLKTGSHVNLERALSLNTRLGGHIVSGHIDGTGKISKIEMIENTYWYTVSCSDSLLKYIIEKGSIAIDGISLTVARVTHSNFQVSIIPHTLKETILMDKKAGDTVNLENDVIGKYVERLITFKGEYTEKKESRITKAFLLENGF